MNRRRHDVGAILALAGCLWVGTMLAAAAPEALPGSDIAVVVNKKNPVENLSLSELRRIFRAERQFWDARSPVLLLIRTAGSREREVMLRVVYQMDEASYRKYWVGKLFRAEATSEPVAVDSNRLMNEGTQALPNVIGCEDAGDVPRDLKVVRVNGYLPGEDAYPLR